MAEVYQKPTFFLSSILRSEFDKKFLSGFYFNGIPELSKIEDQNVRPLLSNISSDKSKGIYRVITPQQKEQIIATAGHKNFVVFEEGGSTTGICEFCRKPYQGVNYGIPIEKDQRIISSLSGMTTVYIFYVTGNHCSEQHAYGAISMYVKYLEKKEKYIEYFILKYSLTYPGKEFLPCNDPSLLEENGGSMTMEQYLDSRYLYTPIKVICVPVKIEYCRSTNKCLITSLSSLQS